MLYVRLLYCMCVFVALFATAIFSLLLRTMRTTKSSIIVYHPIPTTPMDLRRAIDCAAPSRRVWSAQEDDAIRELVKKHGTSRWTLIADSLALDYHTRGRSGKQCWERWHNHLGGKRTFRRTYTPRSGFSACNEFSLARLMELEIMAVRTVSRYIFEGGSSEFALE